MRILIAAAIGATLVDQVSKYLVVHVMNLGQLRSIDVLPPILNFRYGENRGINFGLLGGSADWTRWALIGFSTLVVLALLYWIRRSHRRSVGMQIGAGLMIGGALGNVLDRLVFGYVQDFLNMSCCGFNNPYVFNVADVFIFAGAAGLILFDRGKNSKKAA
ncbi:MAG: signal peptidase II [Rhodobacteraceae bacterium]|nr:MAG: signal peptidase II [Paracoccaceae bacterium]